MCASTFTPHFYEWNNSKKKKKKLLAKSHRIKVKNFHAIVIWLKAIYAKVESLYNIYSFFAVA